MFIAEIIYPGTWLDMPDRDLSSELEGMLHHLEGNVAEAAIALTMFDASRDQRSDSRADWERDAKVRQEVDEQLRVEAGEDYYKKHDEYRLESERRCLKRKAELGIVPRSYGHKIPFIHAHTFVYAVDSFGKFLDELCEYEAVPNVVRASRDIFDEKLPMVRKIRNSALHREDRSRRYASTGDKKKGKKMTVGFLGLSNLEGGLLCYTIDDGSYQKIAISHETLGILALTCNEVFAALPWKGPPRVAPT
jgi:hypothetical protein